VDQQPYKTVHEGLAVGVHPITDKHEVKKYFGADLLDINILAVAVTVENRSTDSGFILEKERFRLGDVTAGAGSEKLGHETAGIAIASLGGIATIPLGAKLGSDARVIKHNLATKELQATTVNPGRAVHGFLYFQLPIQATPNHDYVIRLDALDSQTRRYKSFEIPFQWDRK
jgi:hypothetical protein